MTDENTQAAAPAEPILDAVVEYDAPEADPKDEKPAEETKAEDDKSGEPQKPEVETEGEQDEDAKPRKLSGAQRAKIREARMQAEIEALRAQVQPRVEDDKAPKEEDFNGDFFAYNNAKLLYEFEKRQDAKQQRELQARHQTLQRNEITEIAGEHAEREAEVRKSIADYDTVLNSCPVQPSQAVGLEIISSDKSAEIAYFLGKNPGKLQAMNAMTPRELAREMGRLEATVRLPSPKKQTTAPPPMTAVRGGAAPSSPDRDLDAWLKKTYG